LEGHYNYGVDGDTGKMTDMKEYGLLESASVKIQTLKTAIEVSTLSHVTKFFIAS
jgi:T-complex protein 1 subunit gamma